MGQPIDLKDLQRKFEANTREYVGISMVQHIPMDLKKVGDYPKKVERMMPLEKFKNHFVKTLYSLHKVVGKDGVDMVYGA